MTKARALDSAPRLRQGRHCSDNHSVLGGGSESLCVSLASRVVVVVVRVDVAAKRCAASFRSTGVLVEDDVHCRAEDVTRRNRRLPTSMALSLLLLLLLLLPGGSASMIRLAAGTAAAADNAGDAPVSVDTTGIST